MLYFNVLLELKAIGVIIDARPFERFLKSLGRAQQQRVLTKIYTNKQTVKGRTLSGQGVGRSWSSLGARLEILFQENEPQWNTRVG
jgi:hypothetical protein